MATNSVLETLRNFSLNKIQTTISLMPIEDVPFPLVILDAGLDPDPMGFVKKSRNMLNEEDFDQEGSYQARLIH